MMRKLNPFLFYFLLFILSNDPVSAQQWVSVDSFGATNMDYPSIIKKRNSNELVVGAHFNGTGYFGPFSHTTANSQMDISLTCIDSIGQVQWSKHFGDTLHEYISDIAFFGDYIYITGNYEFYTSLDTFQLSTTGIFDIFLAKLDSTGNVIWVRTAGGIDHDHSHGITVDDLGNIYVTGEFDVSATFGPYTITSASGLQDFFLAKYDPNGNVIWVRRGGGAGNDVGMSVEYQNNFLYACGWHHASPTSVFGPYTLINNGLVDIFMLKYDLSGNLIWAKGFGSTGEDAPFDLEVNSLDQIYVTGYFQNTCNFGGTSLTASGIAPVFLSKYDSSGNLIWAQQGNSPAYCWSTDVALDNTENIYITGYYGDSLQFGTSPPLYSGGDLEIFVAKFDPAGNVLLTKDAGGPGSETGWSVCPLDNGDIFMSGRTWLDPAYFDCITMSNPGFYFLQVVAKISVPEGGFLLGSDTSICTGQSITLYGHPGGPNLWSTGATTDSIIVTAAGAYWVESNIASCPFSDTISISSLSYPPVSLGNDTAICSGSSLILTSDSASAYLWSNGSSNDSITITTPGTYWLQASNGACSGSDSITVSVLPFPAVDLGNDTSICSGQTILLYNSTGTASLWSDGSSADSISITLPGLYWLEASNGICSVRDTIDIALNFYPLIDLGNDTSLCTGQSITLYGDSATTYLWSGGASSDSIIVSSAGTYWLQASNGSCSDSDSIIIYFNAVPSVELGNDTSICQGQNIVLFGNPFTSNLWSTGSSSPSISVNTTGTYWVQSSLGSCTGSDTVLIVSNSYPSIALGNDTSVCQGETVVLTAGTASSYLWSTGSVSSSISVSSPATYWLTASNGNCSSSDSIVISHIPFPVTDLGSDQGVCAGQILTLNAGTASDHFWSTGESSASIVVSDTGLYWVQSSNSGCDARDTILLYYMDCEIDFEMPNVFTPDNNGTNDHFVPVNYVGILSAHLEIYNRWGQRLFSTDDLLTGWNGSYQDKPCPDGTYYWIVRYTTILDETKDLAGFLTLLDKTR